MGKIRFKKFTFSLLSPLIGVHIGKNPISGQRFMHVAPIPFFGVDFVIGPDVEDETKKVMELLKDGDHCVVPKAILRWYTDPEEGTSHAG